MRKPTKHHLAQRDGASLRKKALAIALSCLLLMPTSGVVAFGNPLDQQHNKQSAVVDARGNSGALSNANGASHDAHASHAVSDEVKGAGTDMGEGASEGIDAGGAAGDSVHDDADGVTDAPAEGNASGEGDASNADGTSTPDAPNADDPTSEEGTDPADEQDATDPADDGNDNVDLPEGVTKEVLDELASQGIFPALASKSDTEWVVYNTGDEATASIKATITLLKPADENHYPFLREIKPEDNSPHYPTGEQVEAAIGGAYNDYKVYMIHWVKIENGQYNLTTEMEVSEDRNMAVKLEYINQKDHPDAQLKGEAGKRKLRVFSSKTLENEGGSLEEMPNASKDVGLGDTCYDYFSFNVTKPCPYVFVSKKLEMGYISKLGIETIIDGTAPFDKTDTPGNDSSERNKIVRSYDTIQYNLAATFDARQDGVTADKVNMYFELTLGKSATAARFDTSKMLWLGDNYRVEYLDAHDDVVMVLASDGKYYSPEVDEQNKVKRDEHGFAIADKQKPISMNAQLSGSTAGENSYKVAAGGVVKQRLVGWTTLHAKPGENILSGTQNFTLAVQVRNADNGEVFAPSFKMWLEGNEENYGREDHTSAGVTLPAQPVLDNVLDLSDPKNEQHRVTVSAGTNFNVQLKKNTDMSYKNWFDFSTGTEVEKGKREELTRLAQLEENHGKSNPAEFTEKGVALSAEKQVEYAHYRYGRMTCYGIALQLYSDTDNNPDENRAAKGFKGASLPVGDISFDLNFSSEATAGKESVEGADTEYTAILWDYNENIPAHERYTLKYVDPGRGDNGTIKTPNDGKGNGGRNMYWDGEARSDYAKGGAPSNYKDYHKGCYYGGDWTLTDGNGTKIGIDSVASPTTVTGTGADTTYHFSVSDYDFDFDDQHFPKQDAGNSGDVKGYDTYARNFSAGCVQVLSVFPMVQEVSEAEIFLNAKVNNLQVTTRAGQTLQAQEGDPTKIKHEVNKADNTKRDQIVLYAPGALTKGSSFNGTNKGKTPNSTSEGFLGTDYWTTSYDCSTFAGDDIWIMSYGMMSAGGDYRTRSMNLLQLFDSRALSVRDQPSVYTNWDPSYDKEGTATFLYAADPDYREGYDTNKAGVLEYMNTLHEEDLVYYTSLEDLEKDGYTCIGVLMELRGCDLLGGKYQYMSIPVHVNGDDKDLVNKTVATVNTFRVWSHDLGDITWAQGAWNPDANGSDGKKGRNELKGFPQPTGRVEGDQYSGELTNKKAGSPPFYEKTEYQDGLQVKGTHAGGTLAGNSLLILSYKAGVNIGVDGKTSTSASYNVGDGETVVDYRLKGIRTDISDHTSQPDKPTTTLTIDAVLDEGHTGDQRIFVSGGSYCMEGYAVDEDGTADAQITSIAIGSDSNNPTVLEFDGSDGKRHRIKVHAQLGANNQSVTFVIQGAPVGLQVPDITFQANFASLAVLENNDTIKASAYISGQGDNRAYDKDKGNTDNVTVGIILRSGTNLTKAVNTRYIELDGAMTYSVTYTNSGSDAIRKIYFYDLLPHAEDIRGSKFDGDVVLRGFDVSSSDDAGASAAEATVYYSTTEYTELYDCVKVFGGEEKNGKISGMNEEAVEDMLENGKNKKGEPLFRQLGRVENGVFTYNDELRGMTPDEITDLMTDVTGLYATVEGLQKGQTVDMEITIEADGNRAGNWYKNIANSWIAGSDTLPLTSNKVETVAVSRSISGVVWYDRNANGVQDAGEPRLKDVVCTLFKKNEKTGAYEPCEKDVTVHDNSATKGSAVDDAPRAAVGDASDSNASTGVIEPVITGESGAYSFDKLAAGEYLVAFKDKESSNVLSQYTGPAPYQVKGANDTNTSDGVVSEKAGSGLPSEYTYAIKYKIDKDGSGEDIKLHSIQDIKSGAVSFDNFAENVEHQDLGLVKKNDLKISKTVERGENVSDAFDMPDNEFAFNVTLELDGETLSGTYPCKTETTDQDIVRSALAFLGGLVGLDDGSATTSDLKFEDGKATLKLKHNQTATIMDLPAGTKYTIEEVHVPGYTTKVTVGSGTEQESATTQGEISDPNSDGTKNPVQVSFVNEYHPEAHGELALKGTKFIEGRDFKEGDTFTFEVAGAAGTPLLKGGKFELQSGDQEHGWTGSLTIRPTEGIRVELDFGTISFDQSHAGKAYTYTFTEQASKIDGITDDSEPKNLVVYVRDNNDGTLSLLKDNNDGNELSSEALNNLMTWTNTYTPPDDPREPDPEDPPVHPDQPTDPQDPPSATPSTGSDKPSTEPPASDNPSKSPITGDILGLMAFGVGVVALLAAGVAFVARRNQYRGAHSRGAHNAGRKR